MITKLLFENVDTLQNNNSANSINSCRICVLVLLRNDIRLRNFKFSLRINPTLRFWQEYNFVLKKLQLFSLNGKTSQ